MLRLFQSFLIVSTVVIGSAQAVMFKDSPIRESFAREKWSFSYASIPSKNTAYASSEEFNPVTFNNAAPARKSLFLAGLYSALIPGGGDWYLGHKSKARGFFTAEALTWIGFASFRVYGNWKKDDFIRLAATGANAQIADRDDEFHDMLGFYDDIDEFNTFGRVFDPDRPYLEDTPQNHWRWVNPEDRKAYRHLKNRSREAFRRAEFMIGIAIVNRLVSIIDAVRDASRSRRQLSRTESGSDLSRIRFGLNPIDPSRQINVAILTGL